MQFDAPLVLFTAPLVMVIVFFAAWWVRRIRLRYARLWSRSLAQHVRADGRRTPLMLALVVGAALAGLAGPRWGSEEIMAETGSLDLVIAVDISRSMLARDMPPTRLARALREAQRLVDDLAGDRLGLVAFAGNAYVLSPLTVDGNAIRLFLDALDSDFASEGGTSLAPVLRRGSELLERGEGIAERVLVVFTDGEGHDSLQTTLAEARRLKGQDIHLVLVAEGGQRPVTIPLLDARGDTIDFVRDLDGRPVETSLRRDVLLAMADAANGRVVDAELADQAGAVHDVVDAFQRGATTRTSTDRAVPRAWAPILLAFAVLLLTGWNRQTAALIGVAGWLLVPRVAEGQTGPADPADRAWRTDDIQQAFAIYVDRVGRGVGGDTALLNAGTAALVLEEVDVAQDLLERAARSLDPEVRFRAVFNRGWLALHQAREDAENAEQHLATARASYREALLLRPGDEDAKWNLELAINQQRALQFGQQQSPSDPDEQPGEDREVPQPSSPQQDEPRRAPDQLSREQAEQILSSIADEELRTRMARMAENRRLRTRRRKDW